MAFDQNKYKAIFESRYGPGSFETGLSQARQIGTSKVQADLAMQQLKKSREAAMKRTYQDAIGYWSDPINKQDARKKGAYNKANEILNNPNEIANIEAQGYTVSDYVDGLYYAASDGKFRSQREYGQHTGNVKSQAATEQKAFKEKHGMTSDEYFEYFIKPNKQAEEKKKKESKKKDANLLGALKVGGNKPKEKAKNKKDDIGFFDNLPSFLKGETDLRGRTRDDTTPKDFETSYNSVGKVFEGEKPGESDRFVAQYSNALGFGLPKEMAKLRGNKGADVYYNQREFGEGGGTDMIAQGLGYLTPGIGMYKGLNATKTGKGLTQFGTNGIGQRLVSEAAKGAIIGAGMSGTEVGVREGLNPDDYNWKQNLGYIGMNTGIGAVADPLLYGAGKGIAKGFESASNRTMQNLLPGSEQVNQALRQGAKSFQADNALPIQNRNLYDNLIPSGNDIANPNYIPKLNRQLPPEISAPRVGAKALSPLEEVSMLDRASMLENTNRPLPDFSTAKPVIEQPSNVNVYGVETPKGDLIDTAPPEYWQKRYEDFVKFANENGYNENNLNQESINELWTHFARPEEPPLNAVIDLAYKGYKGPNVLNSADVWDRMGNRQPVSKNAKNIMFGNNNPILPEPSLVPNSNSNRKVPIPPTKLPESPFHGQPLGIFENTAPASRERTLTSEIETFLQNRRSSSADTSMNIEQQPAGKAKENPDLLLSLNPSALKTIKTSKGLEKMSKEELQGLVTQLSAKQQTVKGKKQLAAVQADLEKVNQFLMKLDLQQFGEKAVKPVKSPTSSETLLDTQRQASGDIDSFRTRVNRNPVKKKNSLVPNLRTQFIDDVAPLEALEKNIAGEIGSAENSLYKQARLFKGSPEKAHLIVREKLQPIFKNLQDNKLSADDLGDYALAVHAKDVNGKGINSGFTNAEIEDVINKLGTDAMETARKQLLTVNNNILDMLKEGGILNDAQIQGMREKWPNYVSLFRAFDDDKIDFANGMSKALANASSPIKRLEGSNREVINPLESVIKNIFKATNTVDRNKVGTQLAKLAQKDTDGAFIRKLADKEEVGRLNVVSVLENGKKVKYEVPPEVYRTMMNLDKESSNTLIKILQKPASLLRAGATLTPEFSLRNPLRDVPNAFVVSESGFNPLVDFPVGLWQSIWKGRSIKIGNKEFKTSGDHYKNFIKENGGYGNIISMDRKLHQETLKKVLKEVNTNYVDVLSPKTYTSLMKQFANPISTLRTIADVSETATKVGEYRAAIKKAGVSPQEAAYRARDIMDFGRAGVSVREANKVVAFLNANIQGKSKLYRAFKNNPVKVTGRAVAAVTIPTIGAIVAQNTYSNERQKKIINDAPRWMKDTFWLLPIPGTNQIARIPKPFDLAFPFSNTLERAFDYAAKNDKDAFDNFIKQGFSAASVPVMLTGMAPIVEGIANYSFFRQGPVIPKREEGLNYPDQYDVNTSETAKFVGKGINKVTGGQGAFKNFGSPRIIDNTIQGFTGGLGTYATSIIDLFAKGGEGEPVRPKKSIDQLPLAKAFLVNQSSSGESLDKLYTMKEKLTKARGSAKQNYQPFKDEGKYQVVNNVTKTLSDVNKLIRTIENDPNLSAKDKRSRLDQLIEQRNTISRQAMENLKRMER